MSAKKTNKEEAVSELREIIKALEAKNAALYDDCCDLQKQNELLVAESVEVENNYSDERKRRVKAEKVCNAMQNEAKYLAIQLEAAKTMRALEKRKRHGSIPKLVIVSTGSLVALVVPYTLQQMTVIGPQLAFTIEAVLLMVIAWCYALIWDRSRK